MIKLQYSLFSFPMRPYVKVEENITPIIIGYYPFRAKAQLPRLLCEYLHIKYVDLYFNPDEWNRFKDNEARDWIIKDLPFLIDGTFVVTGHTALTHYIIEKSGRVEFEGRDLADKLKIDCLKSKHDLKNAIIALICTHRPSNSSQVSKDMMEIWKNKVEPVLSEYQIDCPESGWYYGYVTVMDFVVYELMNLISVMFPKELNKLDRLKALRNRFSCIPEIRGYENSQRAVLEFSPVEYFRRFKEEKLRNSMNGSISRQAGSGMEEE